MLRKQFANVVPEMALTAVCVASETVDADTTAIICLVFSSSAFDHRMS